VNDGYQIIVESDKLAKNILLSTDAEGFFDDNYFDLLPGERKIVLFKTAGTLDDPKSAFRVKSLADTYK
jgi:beta-mannosidase